jgi:ABC-2 type transport system permease protein
MRSKLWLIAAHEYKKQVLTKGFVISILSAPLLLGLIVGLIAIIEMTRNDGRPVGYVDLSGWLSEPVVRESGTVSALARLVNKPVEITPFDSQEDARMALLEGRIQSYYVLPVDYPTNRSVDLVYESQPGGNAGQAFRDLLRVNLLRNAPPEVAHRALEGTFFTVRTPERSREVSQRAEFSVILPVLISLAVMILFMSTSTTLVQTVVSDKDNRISEILATSASPGQVIGGKVLGISGMGLTMLASWTLLAFAGLWLGGRVLGLDWIRYLIIPPRIWATLAAVTVPSYVFFSALMIALASMVADAQESQQLSGLTSISFAVPYWAVMMLVEHPTSPVSLVLSLFPLTAVTTYSLLTSFTTVPWWQVGATVAIETLSAAGAIWLAARTYRLGMLRYGQRLGLGEVLRGAKAVVGKTQARRAGKQA